MTGEHPKNKRRDYTIKLICYQYRTIFNKLDTVKTYIIQFLLFYFSAIWQNMSVCMYLYKKYPKL